MKGICKDEQTMMKEDRKSGERYEKRWKKVENHNKRCNEQALIEPELEACK
jgi:hypothetical protein